MKSFRKEIQTKLLKYGSLKEIIKKNGVMTIIDFAVSTFLDQVSKRSYESNSTNYGLSEAFFRSRDIDRWSRYAHVVNELRKIKGKGLSVLEVGSGGKGISGFLSPLKWNYFAFDIQKDALNNFEEAHKVVGDGCRLPFRDKMFEVVMSIDTAEHIPKSIRHNFYEELKRVHKEKIVITCPMQSNDGLFQGQRYDIIFQNLYQKEKGIEEPNTAQHIASDHPTMNEIKKEFPSSTVIGYKNCDIWLKYVLFSLKPFVGLFCGLLYYLFWKKNDDKPPYWGATIVVD